MIGICRVECIVKKKIISITLVQHEKKKLDIKKHENPQSFIETIIYSAHTGNEVRTKMLCHPKFNSLCAKKYPSLTSLK